jgi:hypothetical protein
MASDAGQRLDDLLLARATQGLDAAEARELARLLAVAPEVDDGSYERAAAALCLAVLADRGALPGTLRARLERSATALVQSPGKGR